MGKVGHSSDIDRGSWTGATRPVRWVRAEIPGEVSPARQTGGVNAAGGLQAWGRHLEDELVEARAVLVWTVTTGPVEALTSWFQTPDAPIGVHESPDSAHGYAQAVWTPNVSLWIREVPSLQLVTEHGSVVISDVWADTAYRPWASLAGRRALQPGAPLIRCADVLRDAVANQRSRRCVFTVTSCSPVDSVPLGERRRLQQHRSFAVEDGGLAWATEPLTYPRQFLRRITASASVPVKHP